MKKLIFLLSVLVLGQAMAQVSSMQCTPILLPKFAATTKTAAADSTRMPIIFRLRINGLKPNEKYRYVVKAADTADLKVSSLSTKGDGDAIFYDTFGGYKFTKAPTMLKTSSANDTFQANFMGEYEGWFGFVTTTNARFNAGKTIYPLILGASLSSSDSFVTCSPMGIDMMDFGSASSNATLVWGSCQAKAKSFVALYDAVTPNGARPLSIGMVENSVVSAQWKSSSPAVVRNAVAGVAGNWSAFIPNNLSGGLKRVENLRLSDGFISWANTDGDGIWGPGKKNTVNASGGTGKHIYLDNDAAALVPTKIEFWARTSTTKENIGTYNVIVTRKFSDEKDQTVRFFVAGGTSIKGTGNDFTVTERTITFKGAGLSVNDTSVITINDDKIAEGTETIVVGLDQPSNCIIGIEKAHTISVIDNDTARIILPKAPIAVKENAGRIGFPIKMDKFTAIASKLMVLVKKTGDSTYIPSEFQLGKSGKDSTFNLGSITKNDSLMIYAKIFDEFVFDPNDTVFLVVRQLTGTALLKDTMITLVMLDNDGPVTVEFIDSKLTVNETVGNVAVKIHLAKRFDADADFTLRCYTALSSAVEGVDFKFNPTSKIINITSATADTIIVNVPFYNDNSYEPTKKVYFGLGILSNSKVQKGKDTLIITLLNDDLPVYSIDKINKQTKAGKVLDSLNTRCRVYGTVYGVNLSTSGFSFTIMDNAGGIGVYSASKTYGYNVNEGDSVMVQGAVTQVQGYVQLSNLDTIITVGSGRALKFPTNVSGVDETTESNLVRMRRVKMVDATEWPASALSPNSVKYVRVMNTSGRVDTLNIDAETNIDGKSAPVGYFDVVGIGYQLDNSSPYSSRYLLTPRSISDFKASALPTVKFSKTKDSIFEPADSFRMDFSVIPADENFTFDVTVAGGTAITPLDYDFKTRKINVSKNVSSFFIRANITDDGDPDGDKTLIFAIRNAQGPCFIGKDSLILLIIKDNEVSLVKRFDAGSIKMYPNPSNGQVRIESLVALKSLRIYTLGGRLVKTLEINGSITHSMDFELAQAAGLYRVQAVTVNGDVFGDFLSLQ